MLIKVLIAALIALGLLCLALVWLVSILMELSLWIPSLITVLPIVALLVVLLVQRLKARRQAKALESALSRQAADQAKLTRPDLRVDIEQMQAEFGRAVSALKQSKLAHGGDALYRLPWYAIIGPPGAGKSTALRRSGLDFPYLSDQGGAVKGVGGTRNCDWWMTNHAVLLDTAGRWTTQEEDHDEWVAFLELLAKHRPRRPLNGLIAAISIGDLANADGEQIDRLAQRMRERIDEVMTELRTSMPVYVLFTKCDLIPGFVETFGAMSKVERRQVWGFTAPLTQPIGEPGEYFGTRFEELTDALRDRALVRMANERRMDTRQRIFAFPEQLAALQPNLRRFVSGFLRENVLRETPTLRGAYFTSGTQEGRPIDLVMSRLAESLGIASRLPISEPTVDPKSYFLHDLFLNVMFEDRDVASASQAELRRRKWRRIGITSVCYAVALAVGIPALWSWQENRRFLDSLESLARQWSSPAAAQQKRAEEPRPTHAARLQPLFDRAHTLERYAQEGAPLDMRFGMYAADDLTGPMREFLTDVLRVEVMQPLVARDVETLNKFGFRYESLSHARPTTQEYGRHYALLKAHLLMTTPKSKAQPPLDDEAKQWLTRHWTSAWARHANASGDNASTETMRAMIGEYVDALTTNEELLFTRDTAAVRRARDALTRVSAPQQALERLIVALKKEGYDLTLQRMIGATGRALEARYEVQGAFTRRAWEERVRPMFNDSTAAALPQPWVLGLAGDRTLKQQRAKQLADLRTRYFQAYIEEWQRFIRGLRVEPPTSNVEALTLLQDLLRGRPTPLSAVMQHVHANVTLKPAEDKTDELEDKAKQAGGGLVDKAKNVLSGLTEAAEAGGVDMPGNGNDGKLAGMQPSDVADAFRGFTSFGVPPEPAEKGAPPPTVPLDIYLEQLEYVRNALQSHIDDPDDPEQLMNRLQSARTQVRSLIEEQEVGWRPRFEALLWPPIEGASMSSSKAIAASAGRSWCSEVVVPFERGLTGRFPFDPSGHDASLEDFKLFYQPDEGSLWKFQKEVLDRVVERDGDRFEFTRKLGEDASTVYRSALLQFLDRSLEIATVFFPRGASEPKTEFEIRIHPSPNVASTELSIGGTSYEYHNGPERWHRMAWPGEDPQAGAGFKVIGANGMHERIRQEGEWGLFRLLESGTVSARTSRGFTMVWRLRTHQVDLKVDFRPARGAAPFFGVPGRWQKPKLLQPVRGDGVRPPRQIVRKGKRCNP